jgi:hypothetical protein
MENESISAQRLFVREYLRSWKFRISSWLSLALILAFVATDRRWLLCTGALVSFAAMLPMLMKIRNRRLNFKDKADKRALLFTVFFVTAIIVAAVLWGLYASRR